GVTFFAYDWYWSQGARHLEHALHDGYFKAKYRHLLKFCLLWANHNARGTSSLEDCIAVTRYWIENYFRCPEYLTIDGKPVVIIFSTHRLTEDLGSAKVKEAFEAMRAECRRAGLKGLYLIACVGSAGHARQAAEEGYDAVTAYNWPGLNMKSGEKWASFDDLIVGYRRNWEHIVEQSPIPLMLPICGGWDSRPWHGENALVRFGRNPENFKRHLQDAKRLLEQYGTQGTQGAKGRPAVLPIVLMEAWNEWGEGSYLEPHKEFGFGYLDAIREVFTDAPKTHEDVTPADVGLGPYDVAIRVEKKTAWEFERDLEGWGSVMQMTDVRWEDGHLVGRTTGNDPAFFGPPIQVRADEFPAVVVRMRLRKEDGQPFEDVAQLFWRTRTIAESEATSIRFEVVGDGAWHEYRLPVSRNRRWSGIITKLRLDPGNQLGVKVEVDYLRLAK
ncbi:MAG: glycoside hydrolase family 99-like domain-containing protein, partial [Abditibacteriales bacterium]|nr:glycoside hydrolase family 99-like domain-containing protein [Abditibacteriales bacterium]MDW8367844.1 glycoside hydrolase family 99-like domain-containing protein [Abditibacteriales bacterium]